MIARIATLCHAFLFLLAVDFAAHADEAVGEPQHLRIALVSMKSQFTDTADAAVNRKNLAINLERHLYFIDKAVAEKAEFIGFPELSLNGYHFSANTTWLATGGPEVQALAAEAREKKVYLSFGIAEQADEGKRRNTHLVIGPGGEIIARHHKLWLTAEKGHVEPGTEHNVFEVKGVKMGIVTCADGSDYFNLKSLVDNGEKIIYGPHANTTGSTIAGWYKFRAKWGGAWDGTRVAQATTNEGPAQEMPSGGWINQLGVYAALHNHAGWYSPDHDPPGNDAFTRFASGAWFIGPDGHTLAQMPSSTDSKDSREGVLYCDVPLH